MAVRSITMNIGGQTLSVKTDASDARVRALEKRVTERVQALKRSAPAASSAKVNLLAVLTFAEELLENEDALAEARQALEEERAAMERERAELVQLREQVGVSAQQALDLLDEAEAKLGEDG